MALGGVEIERHKAKRGVQSECCLCLAALSSDQQHQVWLLASNPIGFPIMLVGYVALKRYPGTCVSGTLVGYGEQPALSWFYSRSEYGEARLKLSRFDPAFL